MMIYRLLVDGAIMPMLYLIVNKLITTLWISNDSQRYLSGNRALKGLEMALKGIVLMLYIAVLQLYTNFIEIWGFGVANCI